MILRDQVLFKYICKDHPYSSRYFYEDGQEYIVPPTVCSSCSGVTHTYVTEVTDQSEIVTVTCDTCGTKKVESFEKPPVEYTIDEEDRARYCWTKEFAENHIHSPGLWFKVAEELVMLKEIMREGEKHEVSEALYHKAKAVTRLTIPQLNALVHQIFESEFVSYTAIPHLEREAFVTFTIEDHTDRSEKHSLAALRLLLDPILLPTNWRLASTDYRLGIISGVLKGYEGREAIEELLRRED